MFWELEMLGSLNQFCSGNMEVGLEQKEGKFAQRRLADRGHQTVFSGIFDESWVVYC